MKKKRIFVAGAGPAGSTAAMLLAKNPNIEVILLDRKTFPRTKPCGSGLSPWCLELLEKLGLLNKVREKAYHIGAARVGGRWGKVSEMRTKYHAAVLLREKFDELLAMEAVSRGAHFREGIKVDSVVRDEGGQFVGIETSDGPMEGDALIVAVGAKNTLVPVEPRGKTLHTIMAWYRGVADVIDAVELYFDPVVKPYYGWLFPEEEGRVNIGIVFDPTPGGPNARERFRQLVEERFSTRLEGAEPIGREIGHPVRIFSGEKKLYRQGVLIVGEAGELVDPATAEGIHSAIASGMAAAQLLSQLAEEGKPFSEENLQPYQREIRKVLYRRFKFGNYFVRLAETTLFDGMLALSSTPPVRALMSWLLAGA